MLCLIRGSAAWEWWHLCTAGSLLFPARSWIARTTRVPAWHCSQPRKCFWIWPGSASRPARHPETRSRFAWSAFGQCSWGDTTACCGSHSHPWAAGRPAWSCAKAMGDIILSPLPQQLRTPSTFTPLRAGGLLLTLCSKQLVALLVYFFLF